MKHVYTFGEGRAEGKASMKNLLGGKGANLAEMSLLGIPVPPGFTITTKVCTHYNTHHESFPPTLKQEVGEGLSHVENILGAGFGNGSNPLLVSVRSGSPVSMPGMMDTILNVGLNDVTVVGLAAKTGNKKFAEESYARLCSMFEDVVGQKLPQDPQEQLWMAVTAVFQSWQSKRAIEYRRIHRISSDLGTACNVQAMVFGNMGATSGTGVAFTRDPSTGEKQFFGEVLMNAQGEDVVAGLRTPEPLETLAQKLPECYRQLEAIYHRLENHYRDMQDMEFTIQEGRLWMLQTRSGKRTAKAAIKIAVDMADEGLISRNEALLRLDPDQIDQLLHPMISPRIRRDILAKGIPASPGAAVGRVFFTADAAVAHVKNSAEPVVLVRNETSPEDIHGMHVAQGILTGRGGKTSHAAVVARGMGKVCVVGCGVLRIDEAGKNFGVNGTRVSEGDWITIDGTTGDVMVGRLPTEASELSEEFHRFMGWADKVRRLKVRANADTEKDAEQAIRFGAEGIGLCRTEHMFFDKERLPQMQKMILAGSAGERQETLAKLKPMQRSDFQKLFQVMSGLPVTVRLLDPPLHEFLPHSPEEIASLASKIDVRPEQIKHRAEDLRESNPMLGFRGCRLGLIFPEIYEMQVRAIMEAACATQRSGVAVAVEIEIPLVGLKGEIQILRELCRRICNEVVTAEGIAVDYKIGTMVETPRAAFRADAIAPYADFFSFGTNDLTQTTLGISRDDGYKFLPQYEQMGLLKNNPFQTIDFEGVGELMKVCVEKARIVKPKMEIGICGEQGGDPESVRFCHQIGLDYVSCSPFRVPLARLAAAQAALSEGFEHDQNHDQDH